MRVLATSTRRGMFCELGDGAVDLPAVIRAMNECGYSDWAIVEQDVDASTEGVEPFKSVLRSRQYLQDVIGI